MVPSKAPASPSKPPKPKSKLVDNGDAEPPVGAEWYGTTLSTVLLVKRGVEGEVLFIERDVWMLPEEGGKPTKDHGRPDRVFRFLTGQV